MPRFSEAALFEWATALFSAKGGGDHYPRFYFPRNCGMPGLCLRIG